MKERPIPMNAFSVKAILAGRKTKTRRVITPQPVVDPGGWGYTGYSHPCLEWREGEKYEEICCAEDLIPFCRYGVVGDHLWVRETWQMLRREGGCYETDYGMECDSWWGYYPGPIPKKCPEGLILTFRATDEQPEDTHWRPSIFMPRWASRILLEITDVRVERVQDISEKDAREEGCYGTMCPDICTSLPLYSAVFRKLWDSINAKRGYGWDVNPWVWA